MGGGAEPGGWGPRRYTPCLDLDPGVLGSGGEPRLGLGACLLWPLVAGSSASPNAVFSCVGASYAPGGKWRQKEGCRLGARGRGQAVPVPPGGRPCLRSVPAPPEGPPCGADPAV